MRPGILTTPQALPGTATVAGAPARVAATGDRLLAVLARVFGTDLRSLAAFRIAIGLVALADLLARWSQVRLHYSDDGLLPRSDLLGTLGSWRWSLFLLNGTEAFARLVFVAAMVAAIAVVLGYRTRLATIALWVLLVSLHTRNPLVLSAADACLRLAVFWGMFLPLGAAWSLDRRLGRVPPPRSTWLASVATAALLLQIAFIYLFTALLKTGDEWRADFTAIWYALGAGQLTTPFGAWLHQFPDVLRVLTAAAIVTEVIAPFLWFSPWRTAVMRLAAIALIVGLHVGIALTMNLGIFPWLSIGCMACLVPPAAWDTLAARVQRLQPVAASLRQRLAGIGALGPRADLRLALAATGDALPPPPGAARRADRAPRPYATPFWANLVTALLVTVVLGWNIASVSSYAMSREAHPVVYGLGLYQRWSMFAPRPPQSTQWFVLAGTLASGQQVSLLQPLVHDDMGLVVPLSWDRPGNIGADYYGTRSWRKYLDALDDDSRAGARRDLGTFLCRAWNDAHGGDMRLEEVAFYALRQPTLPEGEQGEIRRVRRTVTSCG